MKCEADAYAEWDVESQSSELAQTFDKGAYCDKCDGETRLEGNGPCNEISGGGKQLMQLATAAAVTSCSENTTCEQ
jgi:hypothetical protein